MPNPIRYSLVSGLNARNHRPQLLENESFGSLVQELQEDIQDVEGKDGVPLIACVADWTTLHRENKNVETMSRIFMADFDRLSDEETEKVLAAAQGLSCYLYSTLSHLTPKKKHTNCFRLLIELEAEYPPQMHLAVFQELNTRFLGLIDEQTKDPARISYIPARGDANFLDMLMVGEPFGLPTSPVLHTKKSTTSAGITITRADLWGLLDSWSQSRSLSAENRKRKRVAQDAKALVDGKLPKFVEPGRGERHGWMLSLAGYLANAYPDASPARLCENFSLGWSFFQAGALEKEHGLEKLAEMVRDFQSKEEALRDKLAAERAEEVKQDILRATHGLRDTPLTDDEVSHLEELYGKQWSQYLILIYKNAFLFLCPDGNYHDRFYSKDEFRTAARDFLAPFVHANHAVLEWEDDKGVPRRKIMEQVLLDYGHVVEAVHYDMAEDESDFDTSTGFLALPCCQPQVKPVYRESVHQWLLQLGGELLVDMTAGMSRLNEMLPALIFTGASGAGKSLHAIGVGRIWGQDPAEPEEGHGDFNAGKMLHQPTVFHDEKPGKAYVLQGTTLIRHFVTCGERMLNEKYTPKVRVKGFGRLIFAANNLDALATNETLTPSDKEALGQRLVHVECRQSHAQYCTDRLQEIQKDWLGQRHLSEHFYWLGLNWDIVHKGSRFLVDTSKTDLHKGLAGTSGDANDVLYWLLCYLDRPSEVNGKQAPIQHNPARGWLRVNARAIIDCWDFYLKRALPMKPRQVGQALSGISKRNRQKFRVSQGGKDREYDGYEIDLHELRAANGRMHILTEEVFEELFEEAGNDL